jgi:two-component system NarL family sensor kinase
MILADDHGDAVSGHAHVVARPVPGRVHTVISATVLVACAIAAAALSSAEQWQPAGLVAVLAIATVVSYRQVAVIGELFVSGTSLLVTLAMVLLGPAPAVALAAGPLVESLWMPREERWRGVDNAAISVLLALAGSLAAEAILGPDPDTFDPGATLAVVALLATLVEVLSFAFVAALSATLFRTQVSRLVRRSLLPALLYVAISATLTGAAAMAYVASGLAALTAIVAVLLASAQQFTLIARGQAHEREVAKLALERARLLGEALTAEERERVRLAARIHDDAIQQLAAARLDVELAARGDEQSLTLAQDRLARGLEELRHTLAGFVPPSVGHEDGLEVPLLAIAASFGVPIDVRVEPGARAADGMLAYSVARELITNAVKHANASRIEVDVRTTADGTVRIGVRDDGRGFDPGARGGQDSFGLSLIAHRVRAAGGVLRIESAPGRGTEAEVELRQA